jgi:isoquinoline 1-oxidoreductase beta subunit
MAGIRDTVGGKSGRLHVSRRSLLVGATAAGGLALAWSVWPRDYQPNLTAAADEHIFNAFLKIGDDGHISVIVPQCEMGQGVTTLLPQIIADELGADWRTIAVETAPISPLYANTLLVDEDSRTFMPRAGVPDFVQDMRSWARREGGVDADRRDRRSRRQARRRRRAGRRNGPLPQGRDSEAGAAALNFFAPIPCADYQQRA